MKFAINIRAKRGFHDPQAIYFLFHFFQKLYLSVFVDLIYFFLYLNEL